MIELRNIGLVNWYVLDVEDIQVEGSIAVIGENRSGKSTLLDLIQTVMTGNHRDKRLNASAVNETRRRSKRTVRDYCLGFYGGHDTPPLRETALSYLILSFVDTNTNIPASIGIAIESRRDDKKENILGRFIAPGVLLTSANFIGPDNSPKPWPQAQHDLSNLCAHANSAFEVFSSAREFVGELLKSMSNGRLYVPDVNQYLKAFTNAVAFEEIKSVNEFVRDFILPKDEIEVEEFRNSIQRFRENSQRINELMVRLNDLRDLKTIVQDHAKALDKELCDNWVSTRAAFRKTLSESIKLRKQKRNNEAAFENLDREIGYLSEERDRLETEFSNLKSQMAATDPHGKRSLLERDLKDAIRVRNALNEPISNWQTAISRATSIVRLEHDLPKNFSATLELLKRLKIESGTETVALWPSDASHIDQILDELSGLKTLHHFFESHATASIKEVGAVEAQIEEARSQLENLKKYGAAIHKNTSRLYMALKSKGYQPRLVCQQLDIIDEKWRDAAEGLLGRDREAIIVAPHHVDDAIAHYQSERRDYRGCRIVNTRKLDPNATATQEGSLASVIHSADQYAMAFVNRRIGNVRLALTQADLHKPGRAITQDCIYDDGLTIETRDPDGWKIGSGSAERSQESLIKTLENLQQQKHSLEQDEENFRRYASALEQLLTIQEGESLSELVGRFVEADNDAHDKKRLLDEEKDNIDPQLKAREEMVYAQLSEIKGDLEEKRDERVRAKNRIDDAVKRLGEGHEQWGSTLSVEYHEGRYKTARGNYTSIKALPIFINAKSSLKDFVRIHHDYRKSSQEARERVHKLHGKAFDEYRDICIQYSYAREYSRDSHSVQGHLSTWTEEQVDFIENNALVQHREAAERAYEAMKYAFQSAFLTELRHRFERTRIEMDRLKKILDRQTFHYETYHFIRRNNPKFDDIIRFVEAAHEDETLLDTLFDESEDNKSPHAGAIRKVKALLLEEEADITEIQDYRNYFEFDLIMRNNQEGWETSWDHRSGIGSGAERQVPFYVAIGAALAASYHGRNAGHDDPSMGVGLALFDEAFSKMDGKNQRACLNFYRELGLQVVIAAPTKDSSILKSSMDTIVEVFRDSVNTKHVEIESYHLKSQTHESIRERDPSTLSLEDIRAVIASREENAAE